MEQKKYSSPNVGIYLLSVEDVITSSPMQSDEADNNIGDF